MAGFIQCNYGGGGAKADLLWTNPSPNANFNTQTVSVDLTSYDAVIILVKRNNTTNANDFVIDNDRAALYVPKGTTGYRISITSNTNYRYVNVSSSGVTFTVVSGATYAIPLMIYGVKGLIE